MKAKYYISLVTDLVRGNHEPLIKEPTKDLCTDSGDYALTALLRYNGIKSKFPTAQWVAKGMNAYVYVDGVLVYEKELVYIDPEEVEVDDDQMKLG